MTPGACAAPAGAHDHAPVRVRLLHTSAVNAVTVALVVLAAGCSGTAGSEAVGVGVGGATLSGADEGVVAAVAGAAASGCGAGVGSAGAGDGAVGGAALGAGADAVRSRDEFEFIKYQPTTASTISSESTAAIVGTRDGSRVPACALRVFGVTGTADDERSGKSPSDGGAADRGEGGPAALFGAGGGDFGRGGGGGTGRGGNDADGAGDTDDEADGAGGTDDEADGGGGADDAAGPNADNAFGAGDETTGGGSFGSFADASFKGMPRAVQNCSRFSRLVVTNGSFAGKFEVAMAYARR
jgi:hypothetical protein